MKKRRALELLVDCPQEGCSEAVMLANGVTIAMMVDLVRSGLATATPERLRAGHDVLEVATLQITDADRKALALSLRECDFNAVFAINPG